MSNMNEKDIEEELEAIKMAAIREKETKAQVEQFKLKIREMKQRLEQIKESKDPQKAADMKEVCIFTIYQCAQHIVH